MRRIVQALVAVALVVSGAVGIAILPAAADTAVSVTPSTGLTNGQTVTVAWAGLPALPYSFLICDGDLITNQRCMITGQTASTSSGSVPISVPSTFTSAFGSIGPVDCLAITAKCNVAMFNFDFALQTFFLQQVPISFADEVPRPAVRALPNSYLDDGDGITLTLDHWGDAGSVQIDECRFDSTGCVPVATVPTPADGTTVAATASRFLSVGGVTRDCAFDSTHCFLRSVGTVGGVSFTANTPLYFLRGEDFRVSLDPDITQPSPHDVTISARGLAVGLVYSARECTRFGVCGPESPMVSTGQGTANAIVNAVDEIDGVSCRINGPCSVEVVGTDGTRLDVRSRPVSFPPAAISLSHRTGLVDGQRVRIEGLLGAPSSVVMLRRCVSTPTAEICDRGAKTTAFTGGYYARDLAVHDWVGSPRRGCRRYPCRWEVVVNGEVRGAVPLTFASPVARVSVISTAAVEGSVAHVVVRLSRATNSTVEVAFQTRSLSASENIVPIPDYVGTARTVRIAAGATEAIVDIPINEDGIAEAPETFRVELGAPAGARLPAAATFADVTITDALPA